MIALFGKKKVTDQQVANYFVHTTLQTVEEGWPEVAGFISDSPEFETRPRLEEDDYGKFLMIVIAANFNTITAEFDEGHDREIVRASILKFADAFGVSTDTFARKVKEYREYLSRVNHPSKNSLYAMSKGIFYKYGLNEYQVEYFRNLNTPNPIFLKNMNDLLVHFMWDWTAVKERYRVIKEA
jgi:hypothetical protein